MDVKGQGRTCAFTGHRPQRLPFRFNEADERCVELKQKLQDEMMRLIREEKVTRFISGMAQGVDLWAAEIALDLRHRDPRIELECAVPCDTQTRNWSEDQKKRYQSVLRAADTVTHVQHEYTPDCMQKRNEYMVDHADFLIAVWDGSRSGTGNTGNYAKDKDIVITRIDPSELGGR